MNLPRDAYLFPRSMQRDDGYFSSTGDIYFGNKCQMTNTFFNGIELPIVVIIVEFIGFFLELIIESRGD